MKAVVVSPSVSDFYFTPGRASALGALSVHYELLKTGLDSTLLNLPLLNPRGKKRDLPDSLSYLKPYIIPGERGRVSYFNSFKRFGPDVDQSVKLILNEKPDIVFISLFAFAYGDDLIELGKALKEHKLILAIGGPGVTVLPDYFKSDPFDYILTGEAERIIPSFIDSLVKNKAVEYDKMRFTDSVPSPLISLKKDKSEKQWISLVLSRGCPLKCSFCSIHLTQGRKLRRVEISELFKKLKELKVERDKPLHINFEDDNLLIGKKYFKEIILGIKKIYPQVTFSIDNGLDYTLLDSDFIELLIDSGFNSFTLSLGSSNLDVLKREKRPGDLNKFEEVVYKINSLGVRVYTFLICGLPEESQESILNTLIYLHSLPTIINISLFYTVPGLPRFENRDLFLNNSSRICLSSAAYSWQGTISTEDKITFFRLARLSNLIKERGKDPLEKELVKRVLKEKRFYTLIGKKRELTEVSKINKEIVRVFLESI